MKFTIHEAQQGTPEWLSSRIGRVTGSRAGDVLAKIKTGESSARRDYRVQLLCERLTGNATEQGFISKDMEWGTEQEPFARAAYECETGLFVRQTGFLSCDDIAVGCSLDGDSNDFEIIQEIKCPKTATHLKWMLSGEIPNDHIPQITHNLWVTGAKACDFISYDPRLPEHLQLFIVRIEASKLKIDEYEKEVMQFLKELDELEKKLIKKRYRK
jgi:hypothetical protein